MKNTYGKYLNQNKKSYNNYIIFSPPKNGSLGKSNINNKKQNNSSNMPKKTKNNIIKDNIAINNNFNDNQNSNRNNIDPRLQLVFKYLSIENILPLFINNSINFNDLLLITRKDLIDLGLSMIDRNRILYFSQQFLKYAKNYSINEINSFFQKNKNLYDKAIPNKPNNSNNQNNINNINNAYNNNVNIINNNMYSESYSQRNKTKNNNPKDGNKYLYYSNGFESNNNNPNYNKINDIMSESNRNKDNDIEKDSQQEVDYCNIIPAGRISQSRTNTSSKNNINSSSNKIDFFTKYQELTQEVDNYMFKFNEYKQNWFDSKKKYDNLMNSYLIRGKSTTNKKNQNNNGKNVSHNKIRDNKSNMDKESLEKLKILKERKDELKKLLEKIRDKSNHKKLIINYLDEN